MECRETGLSITDAAVSKNRRKGSEKNPELMLLFLMLTLSQSEDFLEVFLGNHQTVFVATEQL